MAKTTKTAAKKTDKPAFAAKAGGKFVVTIKKAVTNLDAYRTLERLFMKDKAVSKPVEARTSNFEDKPKRRGGRIWTKHPNKIQPTFVVGAKATIPATSQYAKDLASVASFVDVANA
ncbi:MAG: hypothetical protein QM770_16100 [Tepidisphaeraceae bacterium]